jgi:hypothetical protein
MASTVTGGMGSTTRKGSAPAKDYSNVETCRRITQELLNDFPFLKAAPDVMYWLMATWGAESNWRLMHKKKDGSLNSLHHTPCKPGVESTQGMGPMKSTGTLIGNGYQYSNVIQNLWNNPASTLEIRNNIKEGWYAHGISACMGTYHIRGCPNNLGEWRFYPEARAAIDKYGLEVDPGQSISQTLFPADNEECQRRSIASGMIIFNYKYRRALETTNRNDPVGAMQKAVGAFLGKVGSKDPNGVGPEDRIRQLNATNGDIVVSLKQVGLVRTGDRSELPPYLVSMADKDAKDRAANKVENVPARPATTNGGSNGTSARKPGCEVT